MNTNWIIGMVLLPPGLYFMFIDKQYDFMGLVLAALGVIEIIVAVVKHKEIGGRR